MPGSRHCAGLRSSSLVGPTISKPDLWIYQHRGSRTPVLIEPWPIPATPSPERAVSQILACLAPVYHFILTQIQSTDSTPTPLLGKQRLKEQSQTGSPCLANLSLTWLPSCHTASDRVRVSASPSPWALRGQAVGPGAEGQDRAPRVEAALSVGSVPTGCQG